MLKLLSIMNAVRMIAAAHRDTRYCDQEEGGYNLGCKYTEGKCGDSSGCLIGQAIIQAQPELEPALAEIDSLQEIDFKGLVEELGYNKEESGVCPEDVSAWLRNVQSQQDSNTKTWVECVAYADGYAAGVGHKLYA